MDQPDDLVPGQLVLEPRDVRFDWTGLPARWIPGEPQASHIIKAQVTLKRAGAPLGTLQIRWNDADIDAMASIRGEIQGAPLIAQRIAP